MSGVLQAVVMSVCMLLSYIDLCRYLLAKQDVFLTIMVDCYVFYWHCLLFFFCTIYQRNADENGISSSNTNNFVVFVMQMITAEHPTRQEKYLFKHPLLRILQIIQPKEEQRFCCALRVVVSPSREPVRRNEQHCCVLWKQ